MLIENHTQEEVYHFLSQTPSIKIRTLPSTLERERMRLYRSAMAGAYLRNRKLAEKFVDCNPVLEARYRREAARLRSALRRSYNWRTAPEHRTPLYVRLKRERERQERDSLFLLAKWQRLAARFAGSNPALSAKLMEKVRRLEDEQAARCPGRAAARSIVCGHYSGSKTRRYWMPIYRCGW